VSLRFVAVVCGEEVVRLIGGWIFAEVAWLERLLEGVLGAVPGTRPKSAA
jgi:hypothetical protein